MAAHSDFNSAQEVQVGIARKMMIGGASLLGLLLVGGGGVYAWAGTAARSKLAATHDVHRVDFPIPFPLTESELAEIRAAREAPASTRGAPGERDVLDGVDLNALATERAVARGKHLVEAFYACGECHGADFGGGVMVDDPAIGRLLGPNITSGKGSRTLAYTAADWDRIVRHGVRPDNTGSPMPSMDFFAMSDRELSDIVSYIRSRPAVDREVPAVSFGPVGKVLLATNQLRLSATAHPTGHVITHAAQPPTPRADATFGKHIAQTCTGCHRATFAGGPITGGPPDWPPAANLTPTGLAGWTYEDFRRALTEARSRNGVALREPMAGIRRSAKNMTDSELRALWAYIKDLPPQPTPR
jgi:mono/diheme cytochrome c family protein